LNQRKFKWLSVVFLACLLIGCQSNVQGDGTGSRGFPHNEQLQSVQAAVDEFQEQRGVPPIQNFESDTGLYERYRVDFSQLIPGFMNDAPASAYENGGDFYYTLINVEEEPEVRVIPVLVMHEANQFERTVHQYTRTHGYPPLEEMVAPGVFELDYEALGLDESPTVQSPYFATNLPIYVDREGRAIIDYAIDLNRLLQEYDAEPEDEEDIRSILTDEFPVAPVYSVPYSIEDGEPNMIGDVN